MIELNYWTLLRIPAMIAETGYARSKIMLQEKAGLLTPGIRRGSKFLAWPAGEIEKINQAVVAGKSDDEIRALVKQLVEDRQKAGSTIVEAAVFAAAGADSAPGPRLSVVPGEPAHA